jgi:hypothetical protein
MFFQFHRTVKNTSDIRHDATLMRLEGIKKEVRSPGAEAMMTALCAPVKSDNMAPGAEHMCSSVCCGL